MKKHKIINAQVWGYSGQQEIEISEGAIASIVPMRQSSGQEGSLDVKGDWISLGGVDLQINGGLGLAFPDLEKKDFPRLEEICKYLWNQGVDEFTPTIVTTSIEKIQQSLRLIADFMSKDLEPGFAKIIGVHLEGPFLNPTKRGAHPEEYLLPLTLENVKKVLGEYSHLVKIITLAPELDRSKKVIPYLRSLGITVSLGHSLATATEAEVAFKQGASMVTHAFNAMPSLHHRDPGLLGAALVHKDVYCGAIADGEHICPTMLQLLLRAGNYERGLFLVSDALAPMGLPDGVYPWDEREIKVTNGTARLLNGTLAGTTFPLLVGVQNLVKWGLCSPEAAIALATQSPRFALGLPGIMPGQPANLLRWHWEEESNTLTWERLS